MIIQKAHRLSQVGEYYFSSKLQQIRQMCNQGIDVINLGIGSPDLSPPEEVMDALKKSFSHNNAHAYQPYRSTPELRNAMTQYYKAHYQVELEENEVLPLLGSKEGIMYISQAFLDPGDTVLIPDPGYLAYGAVAKLIGAQTHVYDLLEENDWQPDWNFLESIKPGSVKLMWVNYPNMPTGAKGSKELFERLVRLAKQKQFLLVNDNPYSLVLNDHSMSLLKIPGAQEVALELNSLSKGFNMAGWRVGMVVGNHDYLQAILQVKSNVDSGMFYPVQKAAIAALKADQKWHNARNRIYEKRKKIALEIMEKAGFEVKLPQAGLFLWGKAKNEKQNVTAHLDEFLMNQHIFITPGFIFGENGERFARISLCTPKERLQEALNRIE